MSPPVQRPTIDALLDRAVEAINAGDRETASALAERVLAVDRRNPDAEDLLAAPTGAGEIRRLTIFFADLVDSTALSTRVEPEIYRTVVGRYREQVLAIVDRYEGHVTSTKGDGLLAVFGHPTPHENDVRRAVQAGLDITRDVARLGEQVRRRFGFDINVRVGVHRGVCYLDISQDDVYGLAANLAARVSGLAPPGTVVVSGAIEPLARIHFKLEARPPERVKGVDGLIEHHIVVGERASAVGSPIGPLVGRRDELADLQSRWTQAVLGKLTTSGVGFFGEAGIGKSRLAAVAVNLAEQSENVVLALIGSPFHQDAGLHPVRTLLEQHCGIQRDTDQAERLRLLTAELETRGLDPTTAVPLMAPVLGIAPDQGYRPVPAEGSKLYGQIVEAIQGYLLACLGAGAGVLLAEDVQWFDPSTVAVVAGLLGANPDRLLIVVTGRDAAPLPDKSHLDRFELSPLTAEETDELITVLDPTLSADERAAVHGRCDGIPLYVEEVVTKIREQPYDAGRWARVPDTLYEPLFARLRSSEHAIPVVAAAATIGRDVDRGLLQGVLEMPDHVLDDAIGELEDTLVFEPSGPNSCRFRHELLREVASELLPPSKRHELHGRVADALVDSAGDASPDWRLVAAHYDEAERFYEAAAAYQQAAADARRRGALLESRSYLTNAISQIEHSTPGPERDRREIALRLRRGFLASAAEGLFSPNSAADFERCLQLSATDIRDDEFFSTLVALYGYYAIIADFRRVDDLLHTVRTHIADGREWFRPFNDAGFGMVAWYRGEFDSAREQLVAATALRRSLPEPRRLEAVWFIPNEGTASIYIHLALAHCIQGDLAGTEAELVETDRRCDEVDFPQGAHSRSYARQLEVLMRIEAGQLDRAAKAAAELVGLGEQHGFESWAMVGAAQQVTVAALSSLLAQPVDRAILEQHVAALTAFVDAWRALGVICLITFYDGVIAQLLVACGQLAEAAARVNIALRLAEETGMSFYDAELLRIRARTHENEQARTGDLAAAINLARQQRATIYELRAAADDFELRGEPARQALIDAVGRFPADSVWPELRRAGALLG